MIEILIDGEWVVGDPTENGQRYRETTAIGTVIETFFYIEEEVQKYKTANEAIQVNGNPVAGLQSVYFGSAGDSLSISLQLVNDADEVQTQIDQTALGYPPVLALPIVKIANGVVVDEIYATTTITDGTINATVSAGILHSGNWLFSESRINAALKEIGADWEISMADISMRMGG